MKRKILIIGAGASGMMAAVWAAREGGEVLLLEGEDRPGKKLLVTGNGRCNFTNRKAGDPREYHGAPKGWLRPVLEAFPPKDAIAFFQELGVPATERNGCYYPATGQASSICRALLWELERLSVKIKYTEKIQSVRADASGVTVFTDTWQYQGDALILCCGSKALPSSGSDGSGYRLARELGHEIRTVHPALCPVTTQGEFLSAAAGARSRGRISLFCQKEKEAPRLLGQETGEIQWTAYGISGIAVFQLSRFLSLPGASLSSCFLELDLAPELEEEELRALLSRRASLLKERKLSALLSLILHEKLTAVVMKQAKLSPKLSCGQASEEMLKQLAGTVKHFRLKPQGTKSFDQSQACAGGVEISQVTPGTLESRLHPGVYFAGELLDVDGPCGGFNLHWAWASGRAAGRAAAKQTFQGRNPNGN